MNNEQKQATTGREFRAAAGVRRRGGLALKAFGFLLLILIAIGGGLFAYISQALQPAEPASQPVRVEIPSGTSSAQISHLLESKGLVRNGLVFSYYLKFTGQGHRFQAGVYEMTPGVSLEEIIDTLNNGQTVKEAVIRFTIPEGYTVEQIADKLSQENLVNRDTFLELLQQADGLPFRSIPAPPALPQAKQPLEGYLFPETYEMKQGSTEKEIVERLIAETERKLNTLPEGWQDKLKERGWTVHQMMTAASLVEREVVVDDERPLVAGIILNRLNRNMPLQIDATVQYALDEPKERLFYADLEIESPYNTYLHPGLPPGPIASPGIESIKAVLYPEASNYLFYVTKKDGSRRHLFAETFAQHQQNIAESNRNLQNAENPE